MSAPQRVAQYACRVQLLISKTCTRRPLPVHAQAKAMVLSALAPQERTELMRGMSDEEAAACLVCAAHAAEPYRTDNQPGACMGVQCTDAERGL